MGPVLPVRPNITKWAARGQKNSCPVGLVLQVFWTKRQHSFSGSLAELGCGKCFRTRGFREGRRIVFFKMKETVRHLFKARTPGRSPRCYQINLIR